MISDQASNLHSNLLFVGLPSTGKTTYLALLYTAIVQAKAGDLKIDNYRDDRSYLNEISNDLCSGTVAPHTEVEQNQSLALSLILGERSLFLTIPDLSGESWEHVLLDRGWNIELDNQIRSVTGFVLFVHATFIDTQPTLMETLAGQEMLSEGEVNVVRVPRDIFADEASQLRTNEIVRKRSTQVSVVDLLQLISLRRSAPLRVSLILSAWDLIPSTTSPEEWLSTNLPLLQQFVETNTNWLELKVWGISAQGGDFQEPESRATLLSQDVVRRSITRASDGHACSVEDPIIWAMAIES